MPIDGAAYVMTMGCDYCDAEVLRKRGLLRMRGQFIGENATECKRQAYKDGWRFSKDKVKCPRCAKTNRP